MRSGGEGLDRRACDRARLARDARFDGRFFTGVLTTRIYCRPTCPVKPARSANVVFFPTAAAAERAGFRPCLRCRPEAAPGTPAWRGAAASVTRALRLIEAGFLDDGRRVDDLADTLGMTSHETALPMAAVAFAAGFTSIRRFNAAFRGVYRRPPSAVRRRRARRQSVADTVAALQMRRAPLSMLKATAAAPARKAHASTYAAP